MRGQLFNIQRFSTGDGPGIRTTVFLKGCPLRCLWCHNPESQLRTEQLLYYRAKCVGCSLCSSVCGMDAIQVRSQGNVFNRKACNLCQRCVDTCPKNAIEIVGREYSVDDVMRVVMRDCAYYGENGGVTLSGGEPLQQANFAIALMQRLKAAGIHVALDTCGCCDEKTFNEAIQYTDLLLFDLKQMNPEKHKQYTGVDNAQILSNFRLVAKRGKKIIVRIPIIPGINDDSENVNTLIDFLKPYPKVQVEALPYHAYGVSKYEAIGIRYQLNDLQIPTTDAMERMKASLSQGGLKLITG